MPPPRWTLLAALSSLLILTYFYLTPGSISTPSFAPPGITHIVLFQMKESAGEAAISQVSERMLSLKTRCLHPVTNEPYIRSINGGIDNSPEGLQSGITHAFVVEFASTWERDYYVRDDPDHKAFVQSIADVVEKAIVVDFMPGQFWKPR